MKLSDKQLECLKQFVDGPRPNLAAAGTISSMRKQGLVEMILAGVKVPEDDVIDVFAMRIACHHRRYRLTDAGREALRGK
jgi:hypothetical protein